MTYQGILRDKFHPIDKYRTELSPLKLKKYIFVSVFRANNTNLNVYLFTFKGGNLVKY